MSAAEEEVVMSATPEEVVMSATPEEVVMSATPEEEVVEKKIIVLKSSDEQVFEVEEAVALKSQMIKHMIEDGVADDGIPLANVDGEILSKVLDYCKKHAEAEALPKGGEDASTKEKEKELRNWDKEFVNVDLAMNFELILAANYLDIKSLLDLVSQTVADHIKDKSVEEVRAIFNIKNDFTPEEEAEVRKENQWAFD